MRRLEKVKQNTEEIVSTACKSSSVKRLVLPLCCALVVVFGIGIFLQAKRRNPAPKVGFSQALAHIRTFEILLYKYRLHVGSFPTTEQGLVALIEDPGEAGWSGPYLTQRTLPKDPWGNPYMYDREGVGRHGFYLYSWGPDEVEDTEDDIGVRWDKES